MSQLELVSKMSRNALGARNGNTNQVSQWIAILVLLTCETITGGEDFVYLLEALKFFDNSSASDLGLDQHTYTFLRNQTQM